MTADLAIGTTLRNLSVGPQSRARQLWSSSCLIKQTGWRHISGLGLMVSSITQSAFAFFLLRCPPSVPHLGFAVEDQRFLKLLDLGQLLLLARQRLHMSSPEKNPAIMVECLSTVVRQVDQVELIAADGTLKFLQDVGSCDLSRSVTFLHQASPSLI